ncbi:hypothetical protein LEP1GSC096_0094 [Leptospira interrogans serovar Hebdomadis str. R499]|nr:hypothetical protein LEP1GSC096_0094 [Leptospira interrogans serovar Hebdomadis str. R499]EMN33124.1 hypothetical protein LEP1GSC084_1419 [Leptospira interrogans serovar Medanensis str. L0448]EMN41951.1 hypothetical protein LEP1GSC085_0533 [Leptospira interrogans str. L0996]
MLASNPRFSSPEGAPFLSKGLVVFSFFPKKPSLHLRSKDNFQLLPSL